MKTAVCLKILVFVLLTPAVAAGQPPVVEKVEPPNWWVGHSIGTVRVLVRGEDLFGSTVGTKTSSLKISNVRVNEKGDHVFFDVAINPLTKPGRFEFDLSSARGTVKIPFELLPAINTATRTQGINNHDILYLIMTDRFADGDQTNNKDVDRKNPRAWHGGDFRGILSKLDYLKELGITAIWLTPWYDNPDEANQCDKPWCPNTNYHGYHAIDYYGVENHFGTMADLQLLVREAHKKGIKVVQDQVANHVGIQHPWAKKPPLENWFSQFAQNSFNNSVLLSPNASPAEHANLLKGWFNELLPDMNQAEPEVSRYLIQNALWWVGMTGIDGIREDTIQYMPREFIRDWSAAILKQYPKYYMVGEIFEEDSAQTAFFQGGKKGWDGIDTNLPSVFDFKLWRTSQDVFTGKKPVRALRDVLKYDGLYPNINNVTTLANNHDTIRFMSLPGATLEGAMLHTAFMLSTRGIPQLYYGEEIAMTGGHDPDNRKDFPGGWTEDVFDKISSEDRIVAEERMYLFTRQWLKLRRGSRSLREGKTVDLFYDEGAYVFGRFFEEDKLSRYRDNNYAVVAFNFQDKAKQLSIRGMKFGELEKIDRVISDSNQNTSFPSAGLANVIKGDNGELHLILPPKSVTVYQTNISLLIEN